jgi:hypothetical protein
VEIELVPDPGEEDPAVRAAAAALAQEGLLDAGRAFAVKGAWHRAGLQEAVERSVTPNGRTASGTDRRTASAFDC